MKKIVLVIMLSFVTAAPSWSFTLFGKAQRNVILIIPDGCSIAMWDAIRAITVGTDGMLNVDRLPVQSRCRTYSADAMITDSAAAATAFACGIKTRNGVLGMDATTTCGDSLSGQDFESILEKAEKKGLSTGLVTTTSLVHATPAAFYSHRADRNWYELIADDLVGKGVDVLLGGGREYMIPRGTIDEEGALSMRTDNRHIISELKKEGYLYVSDKIGFDAVDPAKTEKLLGVFNPEHMEYEYDRARDKNGEPGLWEMAEKAISILSKNGKGFFLMIEAGRIDHAAHANDTTKYLWEGIACDKTIGIARSYAEKNKNTLVIVVADHGTGGPHLIGVYDTSTPDSVVVSGESAGFVKYRLDSDGFPISDNGKPIALGWASSPCTLKNSVKGGKHTGEDVGLQAYGPMSDELCKLNQNTDVFTIMIKQLGFIKVEDIKDLSEIVDP
jgi:alkaline phosphatase